MQDYKQIVLQSYPTAQSWICIPSNRYQIQFLINGANTAFDESYVKLSGTHKTKELAWKAAAKPLKLKYKNFVLAKENPEAKVRIWSGEHLAFWGSDAKGYTCKTDAGIYTAAKAWELTSNCGIEKKIEFIPC